MSPLEVYHAHKTSIDSGAEPKHTGEVMYISWFGIAFLIFQEELEDVTGERDVWTALLSLLPP